jgi:hypothetical protein
MLSEKFNFIVLSPDPNIGRLKGTIRSIRNNYDEHANVICSVEKGIKKAQIEEMREVCPTHRGGQSITSLINGGFKHSKSGWCMLVMEGARIPVNIQNRYSKWISSENDVLFPITVNYDREGMPMKVLADFSECTLNGVLMNKRLFDSVGGLSENPLPISRGFWGLDAAEKGAVFKAILGVKIC